MALESPPLDLPLYRDAADDAGINAIPRRFEIHLRQIDDTIRFAFMAAKTATERRRRA
jgi:hypothetical protein